MKNKGCIGIILFWITTAASQGNFWKGAVRQSYGGSYIKSKTKGGDTLGNLANILGFCVPLKNAICLKDVGSLLQRW